MNNRRGRGGYHNRGQKNFPMNQPPFQQIPNLSIWENRGNMLSLEEQQFLAQQAISLAEMLDHKRTHEFLEQVGFGGDMMRLNNMPMDVPQRDFNRGYHGVPKEPMFQPPQPPQHHQPLQPELNMNRIPDIRNIHFNNIPNNSEPINRPANLSHFTIEEIQEEVVRRINKSGNQDDALNFPMDNGNRDESCNNMNNDHWEINRGGNRLEDSHKFQQRPSDPEYLGRWQSDDQLRSMGRERSNNMYRRLDERDERRDISPPRFEEGIGFRSSHDGNNRNELRGIDSGMERRNDDDRMKPSGFAMKDIQWDISREMLNDHGIPDRKDERRQLERNLDLDYSREKMQWDMRNPSSGIGPSYAERRMQDRDEDQGRPMGRNKESSFNMNEIHWDMPREPSPRPQLENDAILSMRQKEWEGRSGRFDKNEYPEIRQVRSDDEPIHRRRYIDDEFDQRRQDGGNNHMNEMQWSSQDLPRDMPRDLPRDMSSDIPRDIPRDLYLDKVANEPIFYRRERRQENWNDSGNQMNANRNTDPTDRLQDLRMRLDATNSGNPPRRITSDRLGPIVSNNPPSLFASGNDDLGSHFSSLEQDRWGNMQFTVPNSIRIEPRPNQTMRERLMELNDIKTIMRETLRQYHNSDPLNRPKIPQRNPSQSLIDIMSDINSTIIPQYISEKGGRLSNDELHALKYAAAIAALKYNALKHENQHDRQRPGMPRWQVRLQKSIGDIRQKIGRISQVVKTGKMGPRLEQHMAPIFKQLGIHAKHEKRDDVLREHLVTLKKMLTTKTERLKLYTGNATVNTAPLKNNSEKN